MLGPMRFNHIETCTHEVCRTFRLKDDMSTYIATLTSLDDILANLRAELVSTTSQESETGTFNAPKKTSTSYTALEESLDVARAKRLITARENSIKSVKAAVRKAEVKTAQARQSEQQ